MNVIHFKSAFFLSIALLAGCTNTTTIRTAQDEAVVKASTSPSCGLSGAMQAAQLQAAVETIRAGYDRYIITYGASADNTQVSQLPGQYKTYGVNKKHGRYEETTIYQPGPTVVSGSYDHAFAIKMFRQGEAGSHKAISAREILGPNWQRLVKDGVRTC